MQGIAKKDISEKLQCIELQLNKNRYKIINKHDMIFSGFILILVLSFVIFIFSFIFSYFSLSFSHFIT